MTSMRDQLRARMKGCGLEAWHGYLTKHLGVASPAQLEVTAADLRRMAVAANMRLDQRTIDRVLEAIRRKV